MDRQNEQFAPTYDVAGALIGESDRHFGEPESEQQAETVNDPRIEAFMSFMAIKDPVALVALTAEPREILERRAIDWMMGETERAEAKKSNFNIRPWSKRKPRIPADF